MMACRSWRAGPVRVNNCTGLDKWTSPLVAHRVLHSRDTELDTIVIDSLQGRASTLRLCCQSMTEWCSGAATFAPNLALRNFMKILHVQLIRAMMAAENRRFPFLQRCARNPIQIREFVPPH
jgi:hypothetical protein